MTRKQSQSPFVWYDLTTPDAEGARKFYADVVGWNFTTQMSGYHVANVAKVGIGGIMETPAENKGMPPFWSGYISVPDVDETCAKIRKLGGKVHRAPFDIPNILRMAVVGDPTGASFNIMTPAAGYPAQEPLKDGAAGTIGWREGHVGDLDKAFDFYSKMFGWTKGAGHDMGPMGIYQIFQIEGKDVGGMMKKMDAMPMPVWSYYFVVVGIDASVARITKGGGKVINGPMEVPGGQWIVNAVDPQGAHFSLVSDTK